jgi:hypothetical protein
MLIASVVLPAVAMLMPDTHAHESRHPESVDRWLKIGPPPPAVLTAHPSSANAATMAAIDLMKKSQRILRGWIMSSGNWTGLVSCARSPSSTTQLTGPKDKVRDHALARRADAGGDGVGVVRKRGPDGFEHLHVSSVPGCMHLSQLTMSMHEAPMYVLILRRERGRMDANREIVAHPK